MSNTDRPVLVVADAAEWERWLEANSATSDGVRLRLRRVTSSEPGPLYPEALDAALCFGWIDGTKRALDGDHFYQDFGPRRASSIWSKVNREHTERLVSDGRMRPAGQAEVDRAKANGRWDAAYRQRDREIPDDLASALAANPAALDMFGRLSGQNRFAILFRIGNVKQAQTRAAKIAQYVDMLGRGETIHPQK